MHISEAIKIAFLSLWANKLRSALTLLGVVIGVAAVIAVVTFVNGINTYVGEGCTLCAYVGAYARNNSGHGKYGEQALIVNDAPTTEPDTLAPHDALPV